MSKEIVTKRVTTRDIRLKKTVAPIVVLTAYTAPMARLLDRHVDMLLVGDSLGMVLYGMDTTIGVTLDMMIGHAKAVMRGSEHACVIVDMPFGSYQESPVQAFRNAAKVMAETGAAGVKLEGGTEMAETIAFLVGRGDSGAGPYWPDAAIGACARRFSVRKAVLRKRRRGLPPTPGAITDAGAFAVVLEGTVEPLAHSISDELIIPTIGIGASPACDGQVLVTEDILGLFGTFTPKFVKRYADLASVVDEAVGRYADEVRNRSFPGPEHCFGLPKKSSEQ